VGEWEGEKQLEQGNRGREIKRERERERERDIDKERDESNPRKHIKYSPKMWATRTINPPKRHPKKVSIHFTH